MRLHDRVSADGVKASFIFQANLVFPRHHGLVQQFVHVVHGLGQVRVILAGDQAAADAVASGYTYPS